MNDVETQIATRELPLPETQHELELLLEALTELTDALDQYETEQFAKA